MVYCAYCGKKEPSWETKHTHLDCEKYLSKCPEGGSLYEKLGGRSFGFAEFWEVSELEAELEIYRCSLITHEKRSQE